MSSVLDRRTDRLGRFGSVAHSLRITRTYLRLGVLNIVQYRADFLVAVVNAGITFASQLLGLSVIFGQTAELDGWSRDGLLVLVGVHFFLSGVIGLVMQPSMQHMMEGIRLGTFDFTLTKPADSQLLASVQVVSPAAVTDVFLGVGVVTWACIRLDTGIGLLQALGFALTLACGVVIVYSFLLLLSTCAFWFVKLDNILVIFSSVFGQAGRWPITIFPTWLRVVLTFVIPIGFAVTIPAQALTGRLDLLTALLAVGVAAAFFVGARAFWFFALRHYTGASA